MNYLWCGDDYEDGLFGYSDVLIILLYYINLYFGDIKNVDIYLTICFKTIFVDLLLEIVLRKWGFKLINDSILTLILIELYYLYR